MLRKYVSVLAVTMLLAGCGGGPEAPHVYVVGVDCSKSFWQIGLMTERRPASLSRTQVREIVYGLKDIVNEASMLTQDSGFIRTRRRSGGDFIKQVDIRTIREAVENAIIMINVLENNASSDTATRLEVAEKVRSSMNSLMFALTQRNYIRTGDPELMDEEVDPAKQEQIKRLIRKSESLLNRFSTTVRVPNQPEILNSMSHDIDRLTALVNEKVNDRASFPISSKWREMGVYGRMNTLYYLLNFKIGDEKTTVYEPNVEDLNMDIRRLVDTSLRNGLRSFYNATDYETFFQRSFSEIGNLVNGWGAFDRDVGVKLTFIIIGDGKNDPEGVNETGGAYDMDLLTGIRDLLLKEQSLVAGIPRENIKEINIRFCVPQRRYSTDILDGWTQLLQQKVGDTKVTVSYRMFENLKAGGDEFEPSEVESLLN